MQANENFCPNICIIGQKVVILSTRMIKLNKKDEKMEDKHDEIVIYQSEDGLIKVDGIKALYKQGGREK